MLKSLPLLFARRRGHFFCRSSCCAGYYLELWGDDCTGAGGEGRGRHGVRRALASSESADRAARAQNARTYGLPWITAAGGDKGRPRRALAGRPGDGGLSGGAIRRGSRFSLEGTEHVSGRPAGGNGVVHARPRNAIAAELSVFGTGNGTGGMLLL